MSRLLSLFVLLCCLLLPAAGILARDIGPDELPLLKKYFYVFLFLMYLLVLLQ